MPKKKRAEKHQHNITTIPDKKNVVTPSWMVPLILIVSFIAFIPALTAGFVNWDDSDYVYDNLLLRDSDLKALLTTSVQGNHHPLTMLSLYFNYMVSGLDAWSYHLLNILLHLFNTLLVFRLALLLSNKNAIIAFTTAILFGIHPMHVESVAWVSERKDVLYGLFFIAGLISYTKFIDSGSRKQYALTILFVVLSLLSKPAAVIFPVVLLCIDFLRKRKFSLKLFVEKIPFLIPALLIGLITLNTQKEVGATGGEEFFGLGTRILYGFYGIMMYLVKMIVPVNLSPFYPFPAVNKSLPLEYYIAPVFFIVLAIITFFTLKRNKTIAFGILFYLANLLLVLQVVSVGSAVIADRYTYIPYIGLFYIAGYLIDRYAKHNISKAKYFLIPLTVLFGVLCFNQASIWIDSPSLWDHAIKAQPSARAYDNRAALLNKEKNYEIAIQYFNESIKINAIDYEAYTNRGNAYLNLNKPELAYNDYRQALSIKPDSYAALDNLGAWFAMRGKYDSALKNLDHALTVKPDYKPAYLNRGLTYLAVNRNEDALKDFEKYLVYSPGDADVYNLIGSCYRAMGKNQEALIPINKAIDTRADPHFFLNRSYAYFGLKNIEAAKRDALTAKQGGLPIDTAYAKSIGLQ